jgi:hypothetical protein
MVFGTAPLIQELTKSVQKVEDLEFRLRMIQENVERSLPNSVLRQGILNMCDLTSPSGGPAGHPHEKKCPHCGKGRLEKVEADEPYSAHHFQCNECDSTFPA